MSAYQYTNDMAEISGFGGEYEKACRAMVVAGLEHLDAHPEEQEAFRKAKSVFDINEGLSDVICKASGDNATDAMMCATCGHIRLVLKLGWDGYKAESIKRATAAEEAAAV